MQLFNFSLIFTVGALFWTSLPGQTVYPTHQNWWPGPVIWYGEDGEVTSRSTLGPFVFHQVRGDQTIRGIRPLYYDRVGPGDDRRYQAWLFPLFRRQEIGPDVDWHYLLIGRTERRLAGYRDILNVSVFPFFFYQSTGVEEELRGGIFPLGGRVRGQFFHDEADWVMFPLYARLRSGQVDTYYTPFPFVRTRRGPGTRGFEIWPIYGATRTEGKQENRYLFWPLGFSQRTFNPEDGELTSHARGFLPFYSHRDSPTMRDRNYVWPFFGRTVSTSPEYTETRYFWPFLVHRDGVQSTRQRIAPFYTRRQSEAIDQRWILFPFFRTRITPERDGLVQVQNQFLYFMLWDVEQFDPLRPEAPSARKIHLWPFFSGWDSGDGRRQAQILSPLEAFFPESQPVRDILSPLLAIYRTSEDENKNYRRRSFLFQLVTYERQKSSRTLNIGPLLRFQRESEGRGFSLLRGLYERSPEGRHRFLWLSRRNDSE